MSEIIIPTNKYQTQITRELIDSLPPIIGEQLIDYCNNVEFIKNLISPNRRYAKDMPKDNRGRIICDLTNPHIIEDMDYFRPAAKHFEENGCYTLLAPNPNPNSEYYKFWKEEIRRCLDGYQRADGEWVTGFMYWFLNYTRMKVNTIVEGTKRANRSSGFPSVYEGIYWRFNYLYQAHEHDKHAIELARRGCGKAHPYDEFVYTPNGKKRWGDIQVGDLLFGDDGKPTKVVSIPFDDECDIYRITLHDGRTIEASDEHLWKVNIKNWPLSQILSTKQLLQIYERHRTVPHICPNRVEHVISIPCNEAVDWEEKPTMVDPYTFGLLLGDGCFRTPSCCYTCRDKDFEIIKNHIPYEYTKWSGKYAYRLHIDNWKLILKQYGLDDLESEDKFIPDEYKFNSKHVRLEILKGLIDSDGCKKKGGYYCITLTSKRMIDDIMFICRSLGFNCSCLDKQAGYTRKQCLPCYVLTIYTEQQICKLPRKKVKVKTSKYAHSHAWQMQVDKIEYVGKKRAKCVSVDNRSMCYLINDFVVTHNSFTLASIMSHNMVVGEDLDNMNERDTVLVASSKQYLEDAKDGTLAKFTPTMNFLKEHTEFPHLMLKDASNDMTWQMGYEEKATGIKRGSMNKLIGLSADGDPDKLRGKRGWILMEEMGNFPNLKTLYATSRRNVEDGEYIFATMYAVGTANNDEADFESAKSLLYNPKGNRIYSIPNVYDKAGYGKNEFGFFYPAYINRLGKFNKDGVSDVVASLIEILMARYDADDDTIMNVISEDPITPAEAMIKARDAYFPIQNINEQLLYLEQHKEIVEQSLVGTLKMNMGGEVEFVRTDAKVIREFPVKNDTAGALEVFDLPQKDARGKIPPERYICVLDPVNNDQADSSSLGSMFVLDLFTDNIACEFTGRPKFMDELFELTRLACIFYNCQLLYESNNKGCYQHFAKMSSVNLLAETPPHLREKQLIKYTGYGSSAYGISATASVNAYGNRLLLEWLNKTHIEMKEVNGEMCPCEVKNLYHIRSIGLLKELAAYVPGLNVDRIRALAIAMIYREEKIIVYGDALNEQMSDDEIEDDPFFQRNNPNKNNAYDKYFEEKV